MNAPLPLPLPAPPASALKPLRAHAPSPDPATRLLHRFLRAALAALAILAAPMARAHEFNVTVLLPAGTDSQVRNALLLASEARDAHAGAQSDGHLGGLDVYFTLIPANYLVMPLRPIVLESAPDIIVILGDALRARGFQGLLDDAGPALVKLPAGGVAAEPGPGMASFPARYEARYGRPPAVPAQLAYIAARRIDAAVRRLGGVDDRAALAALLRER